MNIRDKADLDAVMARKVIPLLREYFHEDLSRVRAVLGHGNGFLDEQPLSPPPGMAEHLLEPRWRYVDRYTRDGGYAPEAYAEIVRGEAGASWPRLGVRAAASSWPNGATYRSAPTAYWRQRRPRSIDSQSGGPAAVARTSRGAVITHGYRSLQARQVCGMLVVGEVAVEILPKVGHDSREARSALIRPL
jgi:hypothetical protein